MELESTAIEGEQTEEGAGSKRRWSPGPEHVWNDPGVVKQLVLS